MDNSNLTITVAGSMLMGAGVSQVATNPQLGLGLVGAGAVLQIVVAIFRKRGYDVRGGVDEEG